MEFHCVGFGASVLFIIFIVLVVGLLFLLKTAIKILGESFEKRTGKNIFWPLMFVTGFPILMVLFRTSVTMGLVKFTDPDLKFYLDLSLAAVPLLMALFLLLHILKLSKNNDYLFK